MLTTTFILAAALAVDFNAEVGKLRPGLHSSGFGPTVCSQSAADLADLKAMGFKAARTHDWALINHGQRVCDYFMIFPLLHLDAKDPKNYFFKSTDDLLRRTREEMGVEVFYRLGTSIEHTLRRLHINAEIPADPDKVIESFAGTVRHYNEGWANGFHWGIKYWEIWNEPEGIDNMWSPPGGIDWSDAKDVKEKHALCRRTFIDFYVKTLKRLKGEFGDTIKVGGPAFQCYREDWFREIFERCRKEGVKPDFISWHGYNRDPMQFNNEAEKARKLCDEYGLTNCELIVNEWHYFGENMTWQDIQRSSDPKVKARLFDGPDGINGIRSACFVLASLANMQVSKLDQAFYYGCSHVGNWGFKTHLQKKYPVFTALKLFGDILKNYTTICGVSREGTITTLAVKGEQRIGLLIVDYGGTNLSIDIPVKGLPKGAKPKALILDHTNDLEPAVSGLANGILTVCKPDFHSAAFFVTFE